MENHSAGTADQKPPNEYTPRACLAILGSFVGAFCTVGFINSFGVFQEYYLRHQLSDESESTVAWLGGISIFFVFFSSVVSGPLLDVFGPRVMLLVGSFGTVFSIMMTSICHKFYQFLLAQGVLLGVSMSLLVVPMLGLVGQYIKVRRAVAMGIVISGSSLGGVLWPIIINELLNNRTVGFGWTMRIVGFIMIPLLAISCLFCRPPLPAGHNGAPSPDSGESPVSLETKKRSGPDFSILKRAPLQLACLAFFIIYFGMFSPFFFTTSYAVSKGFSSNLSFYTISIINGASLFGRILPGFVADRYGRYNCCIVFTFLSGIIALCWTRATSVAGLVIFSAAYGFTSGAILSLQQVCAVQVATPETIGLAIGCVMASTSLSALAGVPISGQLAEQYGYLSLSIYSGVSLLVGSILLSLARLSQNRAIIAVV
ncbi:hypothetical protein P175DRAFT_0428954 [Aspergillus ochraceoroseus IBT 24754]|uniref:Major facilitator superfamily (MFS) profile domain-containing protein n=2 Tax=Aspergillus ochraceoroseus TaxID=138278 RepID=A0A2T5M7Y4_9EURO|nr:uncharacterized protein P175DRAFT_0428954 [Aspergillus ochraceoroseus IBT 24754]KKK14093.1 hypothetical protein AOCH_000879 [Aspergillus ochraceoroseus]PTU24626.1 hypothetical protein P175DRAFT_0428954 [Aspergillus ochraceoroseus IBT 24754]